MQPIRRRLVALSLAALGVVYGDIGTSPLYAFRECFKPEYGLTPDVGAVYGVLSLIVWALIVIVSLKYLVLMLRLDNRGEGGIMALLALILSVRRHPVFVALPFLLITKRLRQPGEWAAWSLAYCAVFLLPTFDFFPWSFGRLAGLLVLLALLYRASSGPDGALFRLLDERARAASTAR